MSVGPLALCDTASTGASSLSFFSTAAVAAATSRKCASSTHTACDKGTCSASHQVPRCAFHTPNHPSPLGAQDLPCILACQQPTPFSMLSCARTHTHVCERTSARCCRSSGGRTDTDLQTQRNCKAVFCGSQCSINVMTSLLKHAAHLLGHHGHQEMQRTCHKWDQPTQRCLPLRCPQISMDCMN